ncbi:uncharacterized protein EHS24_005422 [Apiotrichum porosum]|uniref:Uncharacterized protein n=1 Tax=Apiotrichum porosum TaxID=105984 RepID=A0A427XD80_9TREE|nr:uncharacterized protein EHS24_005422 [Apiotrichum porosum]RSH76674.1 hypothetical protein EHS24_005422 [Apiotrichum porosum]
MAHPPDQGRATPTTEPRGSSSRLVPTVSDATTSLPLPPDNTVTRSGDTTAGSTLPVVLDDELQLILHSATNVYPQRLRPGSDSSGPIWLAYARVTRRDPAIRYLEDRQSTQSRRVGKFSEPTAEMERAAAALFPGTTAPVFCGIWFHSVPSASSPLSACQAEQDVERCLVSMVSPSLNVARGGVRSSIPSKSLKPAPHLDQLNPIHPALDDLKIKATALIKDGVRLMAHDDDGSLPSECAIAHPSPPKILIHQTSPRWLKTSASARRILDLHAPKTDPMPSPNHNSQLFKAQYIKGMVKQLLPEQNKPLFSYPCSNCTFYSRDAR